MSIKACSSVFLYITGFKKDYLTYLIEYLRFIKRILV